MATPQKRGRGRPPLTEAERKSVRSGRKRRKKKPLRSARKSVRRKATDAQQAEIYPLAGE